MVNSSLKNVMARRNHKERAQPLHRQRLGLLEKHKDYVHRARDYKSKQDRVRKLREKAAFRNKDEFYWGMVKGKTKDGVALADRGNEALGVDVVRLLKTQDVGYIRLQIAKDDKNVSRLRQELQVTAPAAEPSSEWSAASELAEVEKLAEMGVVIMPRGLESTSLRKKSKGKVNALPTGHVVFAEEREEFDSYVEGERPVVTMEEEASPDLGWIEASEPKKKAPRISDVPEYSDESIKEHRLDLLTSLSAHLNRLRILRQTEARLATTKGLMGKGAAKKVREAGWVADETGSENRNGERKRWEGKMWKWKLERRR